MAIHASILAWRIPWTEEPGGLQSMGLQRVGHNGENNTFTFLLLFSPFHHEMKILHMSWQLDFPTTCITGLCQQSLKLSYASILSEAQSVGSGSDIRAQEHRLISPFSLLHFYCQFLLEGALGLVVTTGKRKGKVAEHRMITVIALCGAISSINQKLHIFYFHGSLSIILNGQVTTLQTLHSGHVPR